uniref:NR LBD domain-containing protein n=1 Tax=Caenorhabditis tropicalis TaxID=1561998 RepID=A0A1I7T6J1_9PELO
MKLIIAARDSRGVLLEIHLGAFCRSRVPLPVPIICFFGLSSEYPAEKTPPKSSFRSRHFNQFLRGVKRFAEDSLLLGFSLELKRRVVENVQDVYDLVMINFRNL